MPFRRGRGAGPPDSLVRIRAVRSGQVASVLRILWRTRLRYCAARPTLLSNPVPRVRSRRPPACRYGGGCVPGPSQGLYVGDCLRSSRRHRRLPLWTAPAGPHLTDLGAVYFTDSCSADGGIPDEPARGLAGAVVLNPSDSVQQLVRRRRFDGYLCILAGPDRPALPLFRASVHLRGLIPRPPNDARVHDRTPGPTKKADLAAWVMLIGVIVPLLGNRATPRHPQRPALVRTHRPGPERLGAGRPSRISGWPNRGRAGHPSSHGAARPGRWRPGLLLVPSLPGPPSVGRSLATRGHPACGPWRGRDPFSAAWPDRPAVSSLPGARAPPPNASRPGQPACRLTATAGSGGSTILAAGSAGRAPARKRPPVGLHAGALGRTKVQA